MFSKGFKPEGSENPQILILGSFPSLVSLQLREYYAFNRNHFWKILTQAFDENEIHAWPEKLKFLKQKKIIIWDVIKSCFRIGSLDKNINDEQPNQIIQLLSIHKRINRIGLNGNKAGAIFFKYFGLSFQAKKPAIGQSAFWIHPHLENRVFQLYQLPSTSPVPTRNFRNLEDKLSCWQDFLVPE